MEHHKLLEHFTKDVGLIQKIFGTSDSIMSDEFLERRKNRLSKVYNKTDVNDVFPSQLDESKLQWILDILFRVPQISEQSEERKKLFGLF